MLHSYTLIFDTKANTFHFCDEKLGWRPGEGQDREIWHAAGQNLFESIELALVDADVAKRLYHLEKIRECGNSIDYEAVFFVSENFQAGLDFYISGNGSKWAGCPQDPLSALLIKLDHYSLDPKTSNNGFKHPLHFQDKKKDDPNLRFDGHVQYFGNFINVSHGFNLYVLKGSETEKLLDSKIANNIQCDAYQSALQALQQEQ